MNNPFSNELSRLRYIEYLIGSESTNICVDDEYKGVYCPHCSSCFEDNHKLNNHIDKEHEDMWINCPHCKECFKYPTELGKHFKENHPFEPSDTSSKYSAQLEIKPSLNKQRKKKQEFNKKNIKISYVKPLCFGKYKDHKSCKYCLVEKLCKKR